MDIEKGRLFAFLSEIDRHLGRRIDLIAVGGTAMTILGLKTSTIDIDFEVSGPDAAAFREALKAVPHGFRIDIFGDGLIFSQQLPDDHLKMLVQVDVPLEKIRLYSLHPLDIVATKIGRLSGRDLQDIESCIKGWKLTGKDVSERAGMVQYTGNEENYKTNLEYVLKRFFRRPGKPR